MLVEGGLLAVVADRQVDHFDALPLQLHEGVTAALINLAGTIGSNTAKTRGS